MNQPGTPSGELAVSTGAQLVTGPGVLLNVEMLGGTTANAVKIYDGTSTSGILLANLQNVTAGVSINKDIAQGIVFNTGLFYVISGSGTKGYVVYRIGA